MILQIDVTVTGPDSVLTGSAAVTVNVPPAAEAPPPEIPPAPAPEVLPPNQSWRWVGR